MIIHQHVVEAFIINSGLRLVKTTDNKTLISVRGSKEEVDFVEALVDIHRAFCLLVSPAFEHCIAMRTIKISGESDYLTLEQLTQDLNSTRKIRLYDVLSALKSLEHFYSRNNIHFGYESFMCAHKKISEVIKFFKENDLPGRFGNKKNNPYLYK